MASVNALRGVWTGTPQTEVTSLRSGKVLRRSKK